MATLQVSDFCANAANWTNANPNCATILGTAGGAPGTGDQTEAACAIVNLAPLSPTVVAFVVEGEEDCVCVGHTPTSCPQDLGAPCAFNNRVVALVGNDLQASTPVVLPTAAFQRPAAFRASTKAVIVGGTMCSAGPPPLLHSGPHAGGAADTNELTIRRAMLLPPSAAHAVPAGRDDGRYSLIGFHNTLVQPGVTGLDAAVVALWDPVRTWWRGASASTAGRTTIPAIDPVTEASPVVSARLTRWANRVKCDVLQKAGTAGPGLTAAAFNASAANLQATMANTSRAQLDFKRAKNNRSFTDKHGDTLAQRMQNLTDAPDDDHVPEIHRLLAKSRTKSRDHAIIQAALAARAVESSVPLTYSGAPVPTTKLVKDVFRSCAPSGTGLIFGQGLTPFAIACEGHAEEAAVRKLTKQAEPAEGGAAMSLVDAGKLTSSDIYFPAGPQVAAEKLCGWSAAIDVFHGPNHDVSRSVRTVVPAVGPALHRLHNTFTDGGAAGMDLICRVLCEAQQECFSCATSKANNESGVVAPTFGAIKDKVLTCRAESLSTLPAHWCTLAMPPRAPSARHPRRPPHATEPEPLPPSTTMQTPCSWLASATPAFPTSPRCLKGTMSQSPSTPERTCASPGPSRDPAWPPASARLPTFAAVETPSRESTRSSPTAESRATRSESTPSQLAPGTLHSCRTESHPHRRDCLVAIPLQPRPP